MKHFISTAALCLALGLCCLPACVRAEGQAVTAESAVQRTAKQANLRKNPGKDALLVERLDPHTRVEILEQSEQDGEVWAHIRVMRTGHEGYMLLSLLEPIPTPTPSPTPTPVPTPTPEPTPTPVPTPSPTPEPTPVPWPEGQADDYRTVKQANLRRKADTESVLIETMGRHAPVRILSTIEADGQTWAYIRARRTGREGFVLMDLLEPQPERTARPTRAPAGQETAEAPDEPQQLAMLSGETAYEETHVFRVLALTNIREQPAGALLDRVSIGTRLTALSSVEAEDGSLWIHVRAGSRSREGYIQAAFLKQIRPVQLTPVSEEAVLEKYPVRSLNPIEDVRSRIPFTYTQEELSPYQTIRAGDRADIVERIRERLYELGYYRKRNTGKVYTRSTADVIAAFQRDCGLSPTGEADPHTQALLFDPRIVTIAKDDSPEKLTYLNNREQPIYIQRAEVGSWDYHGAIQVCVKNQTASRMTAFGLVVIPYKKNGSLADAADTYAEECLREYTLRNLSVPAGLGYSDFEVEENADWEFTYPHYFIITRERHNYFSGAQVAVKWYRVGGHTVTVDDDQLVFFPAGEISNSLLIHTLPIPVSADEQHEASAWSLGCDSHYILPVWQEHYGLPQGAYLSQVDEDSPLSDAGLQAGDVLVAIGETAILGDATLRKARASMEPGSSALVVFWRDGAYYSSELIRPEEDAALK